MEGLSHPAWTSKLILTSAKNFQKRLSIEDLGLLCERLLEMLPSRAEGDELVPNLKTGALFLTWRTPILTSSRSFRKVSIAGRSDVAVVSGPRIMASSCIENDSVRRTCEEIEGSRSRFRGIGLGFGGLGGA